MILNAIIEKDEFGYFAYVPALEGCVSQGKSYEEALANINEAAKLYLESIKQWKNLVFLYTLWLVVELNA